MGRRVRRPQPRRRRPRLRTGSRGCASVPPMTDKLSKRQRDTIARNKPITFVLPEIATTLDDIQAVVAGEAKRLRAKQGAAQAITVDEAKALGTLTSALIQSEKAKRELEEEGVGELTDEEVIVEMELQLAEAKKRVGKK